jgi:hypothetical protein
VTAPRFVVLAVVNPGAPLAGRLRFLRAALAASSLDAHRAAAAFDDRPTPADARACDEYRGGGLALDEAIALLDRLVPEAAP